MSDSAQAKTSFHRFWAVPSDPKDFAPLPALVTDVEGSPSGDVFLFDRKKREFDTSNPCFSFWAVPSDPEDLEPPPALVLFGRKKREFDTNILHDPRHTTLYPTFEECRHAMMAQWLDDLRDATLDARRAAGVIEHLRTIPTQPFPDVFPEVSEPQALQEKETQEKAETPEPKVTTEPVKHSTAKGKSNA